MGCEECIQCKVYQQQPNGSPETLRKLHLFRHPPVEEEQPHEDKIITLTMESNERCFGFSISGGKDRDHKPHISAVRADSAAGRADLRVNDEIIEIDVVTVECFIQADIAAMILRCKYRITIKIRRYVITVITQDVVDSPPIVVEAPPVVVEAPPVVVESQPVESAPPQRVEVVNDEHPEAQQTGIDKSKDLSGAMIKNRHGAIMISRIVEGSPAEESGILKNGDRILKINGIPVTGKKVNEVAKLFAEIQGELTFSLLPANSDAPTDTTILKADQHE